MDITFKFQKTLENQWAIEWSIAGGHGVSWYPSQNKMFNKMRRLVASNLRGKDSFEVTYHIP